MKAVRPFVIFAWIALPTVMFGGYSLLNFIVRGGQLTPFQEQFFRAVHAHAGVLLVLSLGYDYYLSQTSIPAGRNVLACAALVVGILAHSGGFFLHVVLGQPGQLSAGNYLTITGAVILALAIIFLIYALVRRWNPTTWRGSVGVLPEVPGDALGRGECTGKAGCRILMEPEL